MDEWKTAILGGSDAAGGGGATLGFLRGLIIWPNYGIFSIDYHIYHHSRVK
jgi:hypothetical protein